ncbi:conserved hypothetical protein [Rippkaea orientalis PCC 8801]|uniref:Cyclic nucleotide-binding protein n=1 Tax=Rippkaea orientalis (strain PCC 8801 / RF-1) TaxID=41431 RepID=B7K3L9_RIPO1|nr:hypothetical protein [Rippkaea orientalis]ACK65361.1 conserved hypothetical protein [Rippkaea orientalis PCC 8801]
MFEPINDAIHSQDYAKAHQLLQELTQEEADNPWIGFYTARLQELEGDLTAANEGYHQLLPNVVNPKLIAQIRQGLQRITEQQEAQRQAALDRAMQGSDSQQMGMLILEPIAPELKQAAAQKFGQIMEIDAYSARLQLPSRSWRLYRTGALGKLRFYAEKLRQAEIPCFTVAVGDITPLNVYNVLYIQGINSQVTVVYEVQKGQRDILTFQWSDIAQRVTGMLPIFEECVDIGVGRKLERKTETLDYAKFCDLHLPQSQSIIRFCDQTYHFLDGISFSETQQVTDGRATAYDSWNHLIEFMNQQLPNTSIWSEFTPFGESAIEFQELLKLINSHIDLLRWEETPWDAAFQLYSGLAFIKAFKSS